jgi:hypothetical protein
VCNWGSTISKGLSTVFFLLFSHLKSKFGTTFLDKPTKTHPISNQQLLLVIPTLPPALLSLLAPLEPEDSGKRSQHMCNIAAGGLG